jgi:diaminopimelate epimerase
VCAGGRSWRFQHVSVGNPQCAIPLRTAAELEALALAAIGPDIERSDLFPNRTNVSWFAELEPGVIRARIFERGVGETTASGTGATGAAVAYVLRGGESPVTVRLDGGELEVEVGEDLHIDLTGWAVPVFRGELSDADAVFAQGVGE